ncbi:NIPSNAP family protein [Allosphingosinicella sp.]|uniref:NIPSNAP family protein n=1 Tax=Allosphingosinicella sp. TaxID=2823234 RepID=UPI002FC22828
MHRKTLAVFAMAAATLGLAATLLPATTALAAPAEAQCETVHQLRIYDVPIENGDAFHDRFRDHAVRIMARHGFNIRAMWESRSEGKLEFVYLLEWPDAETLKARWAAFMADEEWSEIKRQTAARHGTFVNDIEDRTLCLTDYSPKL